MKTIILLIILSLGLAVAEAKPTPNLSNTDGNQRAVQLQGTRNTRDLGGLPVTGGHIKPGKVIRSGALCFATKADATKLHQMKISTILELRLAPEIAKDGLDKDYLRQGVPHNVHWPMANSYGIGKEAYRSYMEDNEKLYRSFFKSLTKADTYPILYHCSAGKDRTGILTALLLESLGTPRNVILDDYIHSRRITPKLKVEEDWLQEVFDAVDKAGGIEGYLDKIGVTPSDIDAIRKHVVKAEEK